MVSPPVERRHLTRIALAITCALLALTLTSWVFSEFRLLVIDHNFGDTVAPGQPGGDPAEWSFHARSVNLSQFAGDITLTLSDFLSLRPTRAELDETWSHWQGWSAAAFPTDQIKPTPRPAIGWTSFTDFNLLGLGTTTSMRSGEESRIISIPHWLLSLTLASLAFALWFPHHRRARRLRASQCPQCAYDLRATPTKQPCPECGQTRRN
jgi:hypothetical protein